MKNLLLKYFPIGILAAFLFCACDTNDDDFDEIYGSGSPLPENITDIGFARNYGFDKLEYEYNAEGLVSKVIGIKMERDPENNNDIVMDAYGNPVIESTTAFIEISYPQSDRAVMRYRDSSPTSVTYVFAFGENHFANRIIETDSDGETLLYKITYDREGHLTSFKDSDEEEELHLEWTNGNMTKVIGDENGAYTEITYGNRTGFDIYHMSPFLTGFRFGPFMQNLEWWFDGGLEYALYIGFLGKPSVNLPEKLISYDNVNATPEEKHFDYIETWWTLN